MLTGTRGKAYEHVRSGEYALEGPCSFLILAQHNGGVLFGFGGSLIVISQFPIREFHANTRKTEKTYVQNIATWKSTTNYPTC